MVKRCYRLIELSIVWNSRSAKLVLANNDGEE